MAHEIFTLVHIENSNTELLFKGNKFLSDCTGSMDPNDVLTTAGFTVAAYAVGGDVDDMVHEVIAGHKMLNDLLELA